MAQNPTSMAQYDWGPILSSGAVGAALGMLRAVIADGGGARQTATIAGSTVAGAGLGVAFDAAFFDDATARKHGLLLGSLLIVAGVGGVCLAGHHARK